MYTLIQSIIPVDSIIIQSQSTFGELIKDGAVNQILDNSITWSINLFVKLIISLVIFFVGRFLISKIIGVFTRVMKRSSWDIVLKEFLRTILQTFLFAVLIMIIINTVGVKTVSIAAIIGSVGLAVGLAMKDNLANFAGGVMILLSKPFKGGDYITALNLEGKVERIGILHTILRTADNKTVYIPNGPLSTGNIINNRSMDGTLRTVIVVNVDYGSNVDDVKSLLQEVAGSHPKVLKEPKPFARMTKINPTSLEFTVRVWANSSDLWDVNHDLTESFYKNLYDNGMISSVQQLTVNMSNTQN